MNRKQGFTLVELLVVMAIIAILAAIAIPNIQSYIAKGKAVRAVGEIRNIEVALTKILSDAGRSSLNDLFLPRAVAVEVDARTGDGVGYLGDWTADQFDAAVDIYTEALYVLMRKGREAITEPQGTVLNADVIRNLGTAYFTDLGRDPWGNLYQICPGPWPRRIFGVESPNVFRKYLPQVGSGVPGDDSDNPDALTLSTVDFNFVDEDLTQIGFPAETRQEQFVWSFGANGISGQGRFLLVENGGSYFTGSNALQNYVGEQEPEFMGGGDDINSWDSSQSFMRFYN